MKFGVAIFPTEYAMHPAALGAALEERGFESLWVAEHSHIPASRATPWPGGADLPQMYYDVMDPFVALAAAATATTELKVATGICLVGQRDPIQTAKQVASLDVISGGRFLFGIGGGWNAEEMANHGTEFVGRWKLVRERIEAMKALWADDPAEYHGDLVDFDPVVANPKPVQRPHPPVHVGGGAPGGPRRAARYGDGWIPLGGRDGDIVEQMALVAVEAAKVGRDPSEIEVSLYYAPTDASELSRLAAAGVDRAVFGLLPADGDTLLPQLDGLAALAAGIS